VGPQFAGKDLAAVVRLRVNRAYESLTIVILMNRTHDRGCRFHYNCKINRLPSVGHLSWG
jgi:hypothetical protein